MKISICFLTTNKNHFNLNLLKDQAKSSLHDIDIYEYINYEYNGKSYYINNNTIYFNYDFLIKKTNYNRKNINYIWHPALGKYVGLQFLPLIDMYINHKDEYDFYMFYEDDLLYFGKENLFDKINFNCDVIFQDKRINVKKDNWMWINSEPYNLNNIDIIYHGLLNVYGLNKYAINDLINYYQQGNYCHHEGLISSFILNNNYKVNYINNYMKIYTDWKDTVPISDKYDLCHPVKTLEKYNQILEKHIKNITK